MLLFYIGEKSFSITFKIPASVCSSLKILFLKLIPTSAEKGTKKSLLMVVRTTTDKMMQPPIPFGKIMFIIHLTQSVLQAGDYRQPGNGMNLHQCLLY